MVTVRITMVTAHIPMVTTCIIMATACITMVNSLYPASPLNDRPLLESASPGWYSNSSTLMQCVVDTKPLCDPGL